MKQPQQLKLFNETFWCKYVYIKPKNGGARWTAFEWEEVQRRLAVRATYLRQEYLQGQSQNSLPSRQRLS